MNIYLMRHGETHWNKQGRIQGSSDIELTDFGTELAELSRDGFARDGIRFQRIYTSPYVRALKTARIVAEKTFDGALTEENGFFVDDRIREMCFGQYEGKEIAKLKYVDENIVNCFKNPDLFVADPTGESYADVFARVEPFLKEVLLPLEQEKDLENVLVVCHGTVIRVFLTLIKQTRMEDFWKMKQPNCSINLVELKDGRFTSVRENILYYECEELLNRGIL